MAPPKGGQQALRKVETYTEGAEEPYDEAWDGTAPKLSRRSSSRMRSLVI